jgi:hypothetical protein
MATIVSRTLVLFPLKDYSAGVLRSRLRHMSRLRRLIGFVALCLALSVAAGTAAAKPHQPFQRALGVRLGHSVIGVCPVRAPATTRRCTVTQTDRKLEYELGYGRYPHVPGHIVRFRLTSGPLSQHTTSVMVRFRALGARHGDGPAVSKWFELPDGGRELREFPVHVAFPPGSRIALDLLVRGDGEGEAAAPIADAEGNLNLNAVFEKDDQTPPVLHYSYAERQDFLHTRRIYVRVRGNERALLNPECVMTTHRVAWGLLFTQPHLRPGRPVVWVCELEGRVVRAGRKALRAGHHPRVAIRLVAYDRANNVTRTKTFYVLPTRP